MIITTTSAIEGQRVLEYKGFVSSTAIHGVNIDYEAVADKMLMVSMVGTAVVID